MNFNAPILVIVPPRTATGSRSDPRLGKAGPPAREPLCLFLVTSASWRLRGVKRPPNKEATESSHREPWPANAGALSVRGNEAKPRVIRQNENPVRACDAGAPRAGFGDPPGVGDTKGYVTGAPFRKLTGAPKGSSRNIRHEQPIGHSSAAWTSPGDYGHPAYLEVRCVGSPLLSST